MDSFLAMVLVAVLLSFGAVVGAVIAPSPADVLKVCQEKRLTVINGVPYRCTFEEIKE